MVEEGSQFFIEDHDLDLLLSAFADQTPTLPLPISDSDSPVSVTSDPTPDFDPTDCMGDLERFLMSDEAEEGERQEGMGLEERGFFDGLFVDDFLVGNETEIESDQAKSDDAAAASNEKGEIDQASDPTTKKIKSRQMRNRDSARSSRERKKQYIKELEMKSRYLESECKRLNYSLQCFMSENMALRQSLQCKEMAAGKGKVPPGADVAMQESAVLVSESRQLGSLHWLISLTWCLLLSLLLPQIPHLMAPTTSLRRGVAPVPTLVPAAKDARREIDSDDLYLLRRRCKESRYQMQRDNYLSCFPVHHAVEV